jgi:hypothetical protein
MSLFVQNSQVWPVGEIVALHWVYAHSEHKTPHLFSTDQAHAFINKKNSVI